jgi:hypothetical protein
VQVVLCLLAIVALCAVVVFEDWQRILLALGAAVALTVFAVLAGA